MVYTIKEDELRKSVQEIIKGANLDDITMKTVIQQVNAKYPNHDLSGKKALIKDIVKQVRSHSLSLSLSRLLQIRAFCL